MKFLYALALAIIFFEGFISQCEGAGAGGSEEAPTSLNLRDLLQNLPINEYEGSPSRPGFNATEQAAKYGERDLGAIKKLFKPRLIDIVPGHTEPEVCESEQDGDITLTIYGDNKILSVFEQFGNFIKKLRFDYAYIDNVDNDIRRQIKENIFAKNAKEFTQMDILAKSLSAFLDEILDKGKRKICFPNVEKFGYSGADFGNPHDLNSIFPNLKSLTLYRSDHFIEPIFVSQSKMQSNMSCMENITKLNELKLFSDPISYKIPELEKIFKKNNLTSFAVVLCNKIDILHSIEKHMNTVEKLEIFIGGSKFLNQTRKTHQFKMPNLKKLILRGERILSEPRIIDFINKFKNLKKLDEIVISIDLYVSSIEELFEFQELINKDNSNITKLKKALATFDKKKELDIRMWISDKASEHITYEYKVKGFNEEMKQSRRPTWKINSVENNNGNTSMMFLRHELL